jgi:hypothetical protein
MTLEWLRRHDPKLDEMLRLYLFTEAPITEIEAVAEAAPSSGDGDDDGSLGLGDSGKDAS